MIPTPRLMTLPVDTAVFAGIGYGLGVLNQMDERLTASALAVASIANYILFKAANFLIEPHFSAEAVYTATNALVTMITIVAAHQLELVSSRWAGIMIFGSLGVFAARLKILMT